MTLRADHVTADSEPSPDFADLPLLSTREEVAKLFRVEVRTVDRLMKEGRLRGTKLNPGKSGRVVFLRSELARFLTEATS